MTPWNPTGCTLTNAAVEAKERRRCGYATANRLGWLTIKKRQQAANAANQAIQKLLTQEVK